MKKLQRQSRRLSYLFLLGLLPWLLPAPAEALTITIEVTIGRASEGCARFGICKIKIGASAAAPAPSAGDAARKAKESIHGAATLQGDKLLVDFKSALPQRAASIPIDEDIPLDAAAAKALGFKSVTVRRGDYKIDYSRNRAGRIALNIEARR